MAKRRGKGVVLAGLAAGALSFLSKKENRDMVMGYLGQFKKEGNSTFQRGSSNVQQKVSDFFNSSKDTTGPTRKQDEKVASFMAMSPNAAEAPLREESLGDIAQTAAQASDLVLEGNHMIDEGGQTTVEHYNKEQNQHQ